MARDALPIPAGCQIYSLDTLWWGVSIGGRHYTGNVRWEEGNGYPSHELECRLSLREAKELGNTQVILWTDRVNRTTNRFDTREQLERAATKWVTDHAAKSGVKNWLLIDNNRHNPNRPIAAAGWYKSRVKPMKKLAEMWDKVPDHIRLSDEELWNKVYNAWYALLTPPKSY